MSSSASKLVILDRDGVINIDSDQYVKSAEEWVPIPGSLEAIAELNQAGYQVTVATNQSGLARGLFAINDLHAMHQKMMDILAPMGGRVDSIFFCPHVDEDQCNCRKPLPGLMRDIASRYRKTNSAMPLTGVPIVGGIKLSFGFSHGSAVFAMKFGAWNICWGRLTNPSSFSANTNRLGKRSLTLPYSLNSCVTYSSGSYCGFRSLVGSWPRSK
jgi:D-glycero-D-manno-heptose 1,7-bisphosphate phosphatase